MGDAPTPSDEKTEQIGRSHRFPKPWRFLSAADQTEGLSVVSIKDRKIFFSEEIFHLFRGVT